MQSRGCGCVQRGHRANTGVRLSTVEPVVGRKKINCKRNSIVNKLLGGAMCLFKSELCKQWKQKRNGEQGQDCPINFLDRLGKSPVWHLNILQEAFLMLCVCLQLPLGLLPYVTELLMVATKMLHKSGNLYSFCQSQSWSQQLPMGCKLLHWSSGLGSKL